MDYSVSAERKENVGNGQRRLGVVAYSHDRLGLMRAPIYPTSVSDALIRSDRSELSRHVRELLNDDVFLEALYIASPVLYEKAIRWRDGDKSFVDVDLAVARYALRMAHRPTPFGTFSVVSTFTISNEASALRAAEMGFIKKLVSVDFHALAGLMKRAVDLDAGKTVRYGLNDTIAIYEDYASYLKQSRFGREKTQSVEQLERSDVLDYVMNSCRICDGATTDEIVRLISLKYSGEYTEEEIREFVEALKAQDVLVADPLLDPTADDQLTKLMEGMSEIPTEIEEIQKVAPLLEGLSNSSLGKGVKDLKEISDIISSAQPSSGKSTHVVAFSPGSSGSLSEKSVKKVEGAILGLAVFSPKQSQLNKFVERFTDLFGDASVPLSDLFPMLDALGYPDQIRPVAPLADSLLKDNKARNLGVTHPLSAAEAHAVAIMAASGRSDYIDISTFVPPTKARVANAAPSSCLLAWLALWDAGEGQSQIELKSVGGQEPGRIFGRFSKALPDLRSYLNETEQTLEGSVAAQIVGIPVNSAGNVISRAATSSPEIRIRAGGKQGDILLSDLEVFISKGKVTLWSKSRKVEIVPRMNSAHSFDQCKGSPVYVFLNQVANQESYCRMPSLRSKFQDAPFLPGLVYEGIIIERPSWYLTCDLLGISGCSDEQALTKLLHWAERVRLPEIVELHDKMSYLLFSLASAWMAKDFLKELRKRGSLTLKCAFPKNMQPLMSSSSGKHIHEVLVSLRAEKRSNEMSKSRPSFDHNRGDSWVYVSAYCKAANQNSVITSLTSAVNSAVGYIVPHFFVRYRDEVGTHARLRFKSSSSGDRALITAAAESACKMLTKSGVLQSFKFMTYVPEIERYQGESLMKLAEEVFVLDSGSMISSFGKYNKDVHEYWRSAAAGADALLTAMGVESLSERLKFATAASSDFQREMKFDVAQRKLIGEIFKKSKPLILDSGECDPDIRGFRELTSINAIKSLFAKSNDFRSLSEENAYKYRWSMVHMRFNRFFLRHPRLQEAVCWELMKRSYLRNKMKMESAIV